MFGISLWDASLAPALLVAAAAGLLSFLSPCVLPIVPPYLAFMAGSSLDEAGRRDRRTVEAAVFFVLGLGTVFLMMGFAASTLGRWLLAWQRELGILAGVVIVLFGLHFLKVVPVPFLAREARLDARAEPGTPLGAYLFGLAFAFGWTPCIGPVLGTILSVAMQSGSTARGLLLMTAYALGLGLPFILTAVFLGRALRLMHGVKPHMAKIEQAMGALLVVVGLLMLSGGFRSLSFWLLETFPALARIG